MILHEGEKTRGLKLHVPCNVQSLELSLRTDDAAAHIYVVSPKCIAY